MDDARPSPAFHADPALCRGDGICVESCPKDVLELREGTARVAEGRGRHCLGCGQCVAVCPTMVAAVEGMAPTELVEQAGPKVDYDTLLRFFAARRSVRLFGDEPVDRALLDRIVAAAGTAPMAFDHTTEVLVLDRREQIEHLAGEARRLYAKLLRLHDNPVARLVIRLKRGAETAHALRSHVLGIVADDNAQFEKTGEDRYLYRAPALLLFHANRWAVSYEANAIVAATYAMLAAHALGLGATLLSILPPLLNNFADLRPACGLGEDDRVVMALVVGHPKYRYRRGLRRRVKQARYLGS